MGAAHHELAQAARIPVSRLRVHPRNIRTRLTQLDELAASIRHEGVIEPLIAHRKFLRKAGVQDLELIAGHRRLAAAEIAGLKTVPVIVLPTMRDDEVILAMLGENVSRVAVEPSDLSRAVRTLRNEFGHDEDSIAERLGISVTDLRKLAPEGGHDLTPGQLRQRAGSRAFAHRPAERAERSRRARTQPRITPTRIHELLTEHDQGALTADDVVARLRGHLGGWAPTPRDEQDRRRKQTRDAAAAQLDEAAVDGLCAGTRKATDATPAEIHAAVKRLSEQQLLVKQIAARIGLTDRQVWRYRRGLEAGRGIGRAAS